MNVKELIEKLKEVPQDLPIRVEPIDENVADNAWEYEVSGEVVLITSE